MYCINGIVNAVKGYVSSINKYLLPDVPKIVIDNVSVVYPSKDKITDYIGKSTCKSLIKFKYHTELDGEEFKQKSESIELPLLIDGIYIVDGKCKLPLNYIVNDDTCTIYENRIKISSSMYISKVNGLKIAKDDDRSQYEQVDYDEIDPELLQIPDYIGKKLSILFDIEPTPKVFTKEVVEQIMENLKSKKRDNVLNKKIMTPEMALIRNLEVGRKQVISHIRGKYYHSIRYRKHDNKGTLYLKSLQNAIDKFFRGTDKFFTGIQNPTNANPLIFESMRSKVIFEDDSSRTKKGLLPYSKYDLSFYGLVDPAVTPDNTNSSRVNELTRSVVIKNGETYVKALNNDFKQIEVKYIDYVSSRVLCSEEIDYDFNEMANSTKLKKCKYKFREIMSDHWDYMEMSPDYRLSLSAAQIPMVNLTDSVRIGMGSRMINQAVAVVGAEDRRVSSGNENLESNPLVVKFDQPLGEVTEVDGGIITIKLPDGSKVTRSIPTPIRGNNGININFESAVKEGDKIGLNDTLIKPTSIGTDHKLKLGVNARVAMMTYRGYNFEDGFIVSESFAKKMTHVTVEDLRVEITPDIILEGYKDSGDKIDSSMSLAIGKQKRTLTGSSKEFLSDIGLNKKFYNDWVARTPLNIEDGFIFDCIIIPGTEISRSEETMQLLEDGRIKQFDRKYPDIQGWVEDEYLSTNLQYLNRDKFKPTKGSAYSLIYRIVVKHKLRPLDKLTNFFGSKGIVGLILPDTQMPYDEYGNPVEVLMNPDAVLSRKNMPQTMELEINQLMDKVFEIDSGLIAEGKLDEVRANFKKYKMPRYFKMSDEEIIEYHQTHKNYQYVTGSFSKIGPKELIQWKEELGISAGIQLWDGKTKKKIRQPIMVADMYLIKLYHLADAVAKVTTEKIPGVHTLVMGKGNITTKGSRHGNMEMDMIIANNMLGYAKRMKAADGDSAGWLLAQSLLSGLIFKPGEGYEG